MKQKLMHKNPV